MDPSSPSSHLGNLLAMVTTPIMAVVASFANVETWLRLATLAVGVAVGIVGFLNQCYIWRNRKRIAVNVEVPKG